MATPITTPTTPSITTQKTDTVAEFQTLIDGINSLLTGIDPFLLNGTSIARSDLLAKFQARVDAANKTKADRKQLTQDVAAEKLAVAAADPLRKAVKAFCIARFGAYNPILQQLGFVQNRTPKAKPAKKAAGATKAKATRAVRGTKGKQQKAAASEAAATAAPAVSAPAPAPVTTAARAPFGAAPAAGSSGPTS